MTDIAHIRALVVDDQATMRALAKLYLVQLGFRAIDEAATAPEALAKLQAEEFAFALFDWNLEGVSGLELLKAVRKIETLKRLPIIMATSEAGAGKVKEALMAGASHYVIKPFQAGDLRKRLEQILRRPLLLASNNAA